MKVFLAKGFVSTPMISMGALRMKCDLGIVITASHNPPSYNGYKLKSKDGGPSDPAIVQEVEDMIPDAIDLNLKSVDDYEKEKIVGYNEMLGWNGTVEVIPFMEGISTTSLIDKK